MADDMIMIKFKNSNKETSFECKDDITNLRTETEKFMSMIFNNGAVENLENSSDFKLESNKHYIAGTNLGDIILKGDLVLNIGDTISCTLTDGRKVTFDVTDADNEAYRLEMQELLEYVPHTDIDDWYEHKMWELLPYTIRYYIIPTKRKYLVNGAGELKEKEMHLFMPSASEVFSEAEFNRWDFLGDRGVYSQMDFYKTIRNRIRWLMNPDEEDYNGCSDSWWLSSARSGNSTNFALVNGIGGANGGSASTPSIAAPVCFRIRKI